MTSYHQPARTLLLKLLAAAAACLLSACASTTPEWDANFGNTVRTALAQQVLNPDASKNPDQVDGMDGRAARGALDRYQKSFRQPDPQPNVFTIGVGGGSN